MNKLFIFCLVGGCLFGCGGVGVTVDTTQDSEVDADVEIFSEIGPDTSDNAEVVPDAILEVDLTQDSEVDADVDTAPDVVEELGPTIVSQSWDPVEGDWLLNTYEGNLSEKCWSSVSFSRELLLQPPKGKPIFKRRLDIEARVNVGAGPAHTVTQEMSYLIGSHDLSGDGVPDLLIRTISEGGFGGDFVMKSNEDSPEGYEDKIPVWWMSGGGHCFAFADFTNDGTVDAICSTSQGELRVYWSETGVGLSSESWTQIPFDGQVRPNSISVGDIDRDGLADFVVALEELPNVAFRNLGNKIFLNVTEEIALSALGQLTFFVEFGNAVPNDPTSAVRLVEDNDGGQSCQVALSCADGVCEGYDPLPPECDVVSFAGLDKGWLQGALKSLDEFQNFWLELTSTGFVSTKVPMRIGHSNGKTQEGECTDQSTPMGAITLVIGETLLEIRSQGGTPVGDTVAAWLSGDRWNLSPQLFIWGGLEETYIPAFSWQKVAITTGSTNPYVVSTHATDYHEGVEVDGFVNYLGSLVGKKYGEKNGLSTVSVHHLEPLDGGGVDWKETGDWFGDNGVLHPGTSGLSGSGNWSTAHVTWLNLDWEEKQFIFLGGFGEPLQVYEVIPEEGMNLLRLRLEGGKRATRQGFGAVVTIRDEETSDVITSFRAGYDSWAYPTANAYYNGQLTAGIGARPCVQVTVAWPGHGQDVTDYGVVCAEDGITTLIEP